MNLSIKKQNEMKLINYTLKINPWLGILISLLIIVPSLYQILDDVTVLRIEYIFLIIGFPLYILSLKNLFDEMLNTNE